MGLDDISEAAWEAAAAAEAAEAALHVPVGRISCRVVPSGRLGSVLPSARGVTVSLFGSPQSDGSTGGFLINRIRRKYEVAPLSNRQEAASLASACVVCLSYEATDACQACARRITCAGCDIDDCLSDCPFCARNQAWC